MTMQKETVQDAAKETQTRPAERDPIKRLSDLIDIEAQAHILSAQKVMAQTEWGNRFPPDVQAAYEHMAQEVGLSFARGDVVVLGGNLYVTLQGRLLKANGTGQFNGFERDEPLPRDLWDAWGVRPDAKYAWICTIKRRDHDNSYTEIGWAGGSREEKQPVARQFPPEQGRKRARARCLAIAFPLGLPSVEEVPEKGELVTVGEQQAHLPTEQAERQAERKAAFAAAAAQGLPPDQARAALEGNPSPATAPEKTDAPKDTVPLEMRGEEPEPLSDDAVNQTVKLFEPKAKGLIGAIELRNLVISSMGDHDEIESVLASVRRDMEDARP